MDAHLRRRAQAIFSDLLELPPEQRAVRLDSACGDDAELRTLVQALLENVEADPTDTLDAGPGRALREALESVANEPDTWAHPPEMVGPYRVEGELGRGGMGVVWRARDARLDRAVALKVLSGQLLADPDSRARFRREARMLAALRHPNVAGIHGVEEHGGRPVLVLELVEGRSLAALVEEGPVPLDDVVRIGTQVASALEAAHGAGIVHRDLNPRNILLTETGDARVLDFGLARRVEAREDDEVTGHRIVAGTPGYMSPEQTAGDTADARSDVWSLGCVLYEMASGARAFPGADAATKMRRVLSEEPDWHLLAESTPPLLRALLLRCLEKARDRRPADGSVVRHVLEAIRRGDDSDAVSGVSAPAPAAGHRRLPRARTSFVGREDELRQLQALLEDREVVTLTGVAGVGKSRLALEAATRLADAGEHAVTHVALGSVVEPTEVIARVAACLGVTERPGETLVETVSGHLGTERHVLILDDCDRVREACRELVDELLDAAPGLGVLSTAREPLDTEGEEVFVVDPLPVPEETTDSIAETPSVQLFSDRARRVRRDFELDATDAPVVAELCRRLDGIPLALELAAARLKLLSPTEILERLGHGLDVLAGGKSKLSHQRTLTGTLAWSHDLLDEEARVLLRRLSIFEGSFSLSLAEEVTSGDGIVDTRVLDVLSQLVDKSLVHVVRDSAGLRYRLLGPVCAFARDHLARSGEETTLTHRHREAFLSFVTRANANVRGADERSWVDAYRRELSNVQAAARAFADDAESGIDWLRLCVERRFFWLRDGRWAEAEQQVGAALARAGDGASLILQSRALMILTAVQVRGGRPRDAQASAEAAVERARASGDQAELAPALNDLAGALVTLGAFEPARVVLEETLEIEQALGRDRRVAQTRSNLWLVMNQLGEGQAAVAHLDAALEHTTRDDVPGMRMALLCNKASTERAAGNPEAGRDLALESVGLARELGDVTSLADGLGCLSSCQRALGDLDGARASLREGVEVAARAGMVPELAPMLADMARLAVSSGEMAVAAQLVGASRGIYRRMRAEAPASTWDDVQEALREALDAREHERLQERGAELDIDAAVALALSF